jgi:hypothetical protein
LNKEYGGKAAACDLVRDVALGALNPDLSKLAQEMAWREDHRKDPNGFQVDRVVARAMRNRPSVEFFGYWQ